MYAGPNITRDDIVLAIDAESPRCYPGTGTALTDITGNTDGVTLSGTSVSNGVFTLAGQGETDGSPAGDYISIPSATTQIQNYPSGVTYLIWIYPDANRRMCLFWGSGTINHIEIYAGSSGGSVRTEARLQNGYSFGASAPPGGFPINKWTQLAIAWDPDGATRPVKWYKNGTLFHTHANFYSGNNGTSEDFWFTGLGRATGSAAYLYATSWSGKLNGLKVYSRTLTQSEIAKNYNAQKSRYGL